MVNSDDEAVLNHSSDESVEEVPQIQVRQPRIFCDRVNFEVCAFFKLHNSVWPKYENLLLFKSLAR